MQVAAVTPSGVTTGSARGGTAVKALAGGRVASADAPLLPAAAAGAVAMPRSGLRTWDPQANRGVADAQQALDFLDDAASQLQSLRADLSGRLAGRPPASAVALADRLRAFSERWHSRPAVSGGSLGPQLQYSSPQPAQQRFTVRGLDLQSLQAGGKETLAFTVAGGGPQPLTVQLEPGLSAAAIVQRFDQALAASGIRVAAGDDGSLRFSTAEADWPAVRDSLAVRGGGKRFPSGGFHRVQTDAEPAVIQPQAWQAGDADTMRRTLTQVLQAMDAVREAKSVVGRELALAGQRLQAAAPEGDARWASNFAQAFENLAHDNNYAAQSSLGAALRGVRRERVLALLNLR